jgi:hypothetical protein
MRLCSTKLGRRICGFLLAAAMVVGSVLPCYAAEETGTETSESTQKDGWTISRSKAASELEKQSDGTYTSEVTLSLPSTEEVLESDVVFVLDESDCSEEVYQEMWNLMEDLNEACKESSGAKLNVGVVFFRGCASTAWELQEYDPNAYSEFKEAVENAITDMIYKGSNLPSGLYAAKKMLESSSTPSSRQHMIVISDGVSYIYTHNEDPTTHYSRSAGWGGHLVEWEVKFGENFPASFQNDGSAEDWENFLSDIETRRSALNYEADCDQEYIRTTTGEEVAVENTKPDDMSLSDYVINVEESLYQSAVVFQEIVDSGVSCYTYCPVHYHKMFASFMEYLGSLGKGCGTGFEWLTKDIIYLLDRGSVVEDVIGFGTDDQGNDYNFDFVNKADQLTMKVGDTSYACTKIEKNHYGFGDYDNEAGCYPYELVYHPEKSGEKEYFEWKFNTEVSDFARAELTYWVVLTNPQTAAGTYTGLLTNWKATLHAVATDGRQTDVDFEKPTVSYTVPDTTPDTPETPDDETPPTPGTPETPEPGNETPTVPQTHVDTTNVAVGKVWQDNENQDGIRPESVTVQLYCNGTAYGDPVVLNEENSWWYRWDNLDASSTWTVDEVSTADGYTKSVTKNAVNAWVIVNTHTPKVEAVSTAADTAGTADSAAVPQNPTGRGAGTGDESAMGLWLLMMLISGTALVGAAMYRRRSR